MVISLTTKKESLVFDYSIFYEKIRRVLHVRNLQLLYILLLAASVEEGLHKLDPCIREEARLKAIGILSKVNQRGRLNYSMEERSALWKLKEDNSIVILPSDRVNTTVVLNCSDYEKKVHKLLNTKAYTMLPKDLTSKIQGILNKAPTYSHTLQFCI